MTTYEWDFRALDCVIGPDSEGNDNIVYSVHWTLTASDGEHHVYTNGNLHVAYEEGSPFIVYEELTQEDVIGWCEEGLDMDAIRAQLDVQMEEQRTPVNVVLLPPWK